MKSKKFLIPLVSIFLIFLMFHSCATLTPSKVPTLAFTQYALESGLEQVQGKSDIEISIELVRLSDIYKYAKFFSFKLDEFPSMYASNSILRSEYKPGPMGRQWEFPFTNPDGSKQMLFCICNVKNNTKHILKMADARIYLIIEGVDPLPAISSFKKLLEIAQYFENITNIERSKQKALLVLQRPPLPKGFFRKIVSYNRKSFKLINDLNTEILPGFSYDGILVFPVIPSFSPRAKISFFDVTTKVDKAGNTIEKTQFDFNLKSEQVHMWYDRYEKAWKVGRPPQIK
ncbi:MAG: hypothetical protein ISS41_07335 [Candidatus Aminicenantes bacterium]|nr:hypothetical protein [Candidatus Aminicenantes bacterium]